MFCSILHSARASLCWEHGLWSFFFFFVKFLLFIHGVERIKTKKRFLYKHPFDHFLYATLLARKLYSAKLWNSPNRLCFLARSTRKSSSEKWSCTFFCRISQDECKRDIHRDFNGFTFEGLIDKRVLGLFSKGVMFHFSKLSVTHCDFVL